MPFGFGGSLAGLEITEFLKRSYFLDPYMPSQDICNKAISSGCREDFIKRANIFLNSGNTNTALLCLDRQFEHTPDITNVDISKIPRWLVLCTICFILICLLRYSEMLQDITFSDFRFGSYSNFDDQSIADARKPLNVVIDWVRPVAVSLEHDWPPQLSFITHAMVLRLLLFTFDRHKIWLSISFRVHSLR